MDDVKKWTFPETISLETVTLYIDRFEGEDLGADFTFDLTGTGSIHSSFIGFLIHVKHQTGKHGGRLRLVLSLSMERILVMLNVLDFFMPDVVTVPARKTA